MSHTSETSHVILESLCNGGGRGRKSLNPKLLSRLRLESLDGRIVPDAMPVMDPAIMPTTQTSPNTPVAIPPAPQAAIAPVTNVAVVPLVDDAGNATDVYMILEQAGNAYTITYYDAVANQLFAGTDSTTPTTPANAQLDAMMLQYGTPGDINTLFMANTQPVVVTPLADPQATGPAVTPAQTPPVIVLPSARPPAQPPVFVVPILPPQGTQPNTLPRYEPRPGTGTRNGWSGVWVITPGDGLLPESRVEGWVWTPPLPIVPVMPPVGQNPPQFIMPPNVTLPQNPQTLPRTPYFPPIPQLPPGTMPRPNNPFENPRPSNPNYPFGRGSIIGPSTPTPGTPPLIPGQMSPSGR